MMKEPGRTIGIGLISSSVWRWKVATVLVTLLLLAVLVRDDIMSLPTFSTIPSNSVVAIQTKQQQPTSSVAIDYKEYIPANTEQYVLDHADDLGYASEEDPDGCLIYTDPTITNEDIHQELTSYLSDLENYIAAVKEFEPVHDVMSEIIQGNYDVCSSLRLHPDGVRGLFPNSTLSYSRSGYVEPILPPMRTYRLCTNNGFMGLDFIVHDFEIMCRKLKPSSRRVLIDMGASLDFHGTDQPIMELLAEYEKFGFRFDHIYAFEITFKDPSDVYNNLLPEKYMAAYHWMNVPVNQEEGAKMNPLHSILQHFNEDDFIVIKLDVDTSHVEVPLAHQLVEGGENGTYHKLVDQFYFEHHVHLGNIAWAWGGSMNGTVKDSLELFHALRVKGIPSHFWP